MKKRLTLERILAIVTIFGLIFQGLPYVAPFAWAQEAAAWEWVQAKSGEKASFIQTGQRVLPENPAAFTMEAWISFDTIDGVQVILNEAHEGKFVSGLALYEGKLTFSVDAFGSWVSSNAPVTVGERLYVVGTYDRDAADGRVKLYVNGTLQAQTLQATATPLTTETLFLGGRPIAGGSDLAFRGELIKAGVFEKALKLEDIRNRFAEGPVKVSTSASLELQSAQSLILPLSDADFSPELSGGTTRAADGVLTFNGAGYVTVPHAAPLEGFGDGPFTVAVQVQFLRGPGQTEMLIIRRDNATGKNFLLLRRDSGKVEAIVNGGESGYLAVRTERVIAGTEFHDIVMTYDGEMIHIFIDGKEEETTIPEGTRGVHHTASQAPIVAGVYRSPDGTNYYPFSGRLGMLLLLPRQLVPEESSLSLQALLSRLTSQSTPVESAAAPLPLQPVLSLADGATFDASKVTDLGTLPKPESGNNTIILTFTPDQVRNNQNVWSLYGDEENRIRAVFNGDRMFQLVIVQRGNYLFTPQFPMDAGREYKAVFQFGKGGLMIRINGMEVLHDPTMTRTLLEIAPGGHLTLGGELGNGPSFHGKISLFKMYDAVYGETLNVAGDAAVASAATIPTDAAPVTAEVARTFAFASLRHTSVPNGGTIEVPDIGAVRVTASGDLPNVEIGNEGLIVRGGWIQADFPAPLTIEAVKVRQLSTIEGQELRLLDAGGNILFSKGTTNGEEAIARVENVSSIHLTFTKSGWAHSIESFTYSIVKTTAELEEEAQIAAGTWRESGRRVQFTSSAGDFTVTANSTVTYYNSTWSIKGLDGDYTGIAFVKPARVNGLRFTLMNQINLVVRGISADGSPLLLYDYVVNTDGDFRFDLPEGAGVTEISFGPGANATLIALLAPDGKEIVVSGAKGLVQPWETMTDAEIASTRDRLPELIKAINDGYMIRVTLDRQRISEATELGQRIFNDVRNAMSRAAAMIVAYGQRVDGQIFQDIKQTGELRVALESPIQGKSYTTEELLMEVAKGRAAVLGTGNDNSPPLPQTAEDVARSVQNILFSKLVVAGFGTRDYELEANEAKIRAYLATQEPQYLAAFDWTLGKVGAEAVVAAMGLHSAPSESNGEAEVLGVVQGEPIVPAEGDKLAMLSGAGSSLTVQGVSSGLTGLTPNSDSWLQALQEAWTQWDELVDSMSQQVVLGSYSDEVTVPGTSFQILSGLLGADVHSDLLELTYDWQHREWSWSHALKTGGDALSLLPLIGGLKYADNVVYLVRKSDGSVQAATEVIRGEQEATRAAVQLTDVHRRAFANIEKELGTMVSHGNDWHIGRDAQWLEQRIKESVGTSSELKVASSFYSRELAEIVVPDAVRMRVGELDEWASHLKDGDKLTKRVSVPVTPDAGVVVTKVSGADGVDHFVSSTPTQLVIEAKYVGDGRWSLNTFFLQ